MDDRALIRDLDSVVAGSQGDEPTIPTRRNVACRRAIVLVQVLADQTSSVTLALQHGRDRRRVLEVVKPSMVARMIRVDARRMRILPSQNGCSARATERIRYIPLRELDALVHQLRLQFGHMVDLVEALIVRKDQYDVRRGDLKRCRGRCGFSSSADAYPARASTRGHGSPDLRRRDDAEAGRHRAESHRRRGPEPGAADGDARSSPTASWTDPINCRVLPAPGSAQQANRHESQGGHHDRISLCGQTQKPPHPVG